MKKFFKGVGIAFLVLILVSAAYSAYKKGVFDTRFWGDSDEYKTFQTGTYICSQSIEEGSYDVIMKGGAQNYGFYQIYENTEKLANNDELEVHTVREGDRGFHFDITNGQVIRLNFGNSTEMRIKKVG